MNIFEKFWNWLKSWGDTDLQAGPHPAIGMLIGGTINIIGLSTGTSWIFRLLTILTVAYIGRFTSLFGIKMEGWHLETFGGAMVIEWVSWIVFCHGPCG